MSVNTRTERIIMNSQSRGAMSDADWIAKRCGRITGSTAAAILGKGYGTPFTAYRSIMFNERPATWRKHWFEHGKLMEKGILEQYRKLTGYSMCGERLIIDPECAWLAGTVDGIVANADGDFLHIVEAKYVGEWMAKDWFPVQGGAPVVPEYYKIQAHLYMHLTGLTCVDFAVFIEGEGFFRIRMEDDEVYRKTMIAMLEVFYKNHLATGIAPAATEAELRFQVERERGGGNGDIVVEDGSPLCKKVERYVTLKGIESQVGDMLEKTKSDVLTMAGKYDCIVMPDGRRITLSKHEGRTSIDWKQVANEAGVSEELMKKHSHTGEPWWTINLPRGKASKKK